MPKSTYAINSALNVFLRATAYTTPTTVYLALFNAGTEVTGASYARQAITFAAPSAGAVASSSAQTFTGMPATTITQIAIMDLVTLGSGNQLYLISVTTNKTTNLGDTVTVASGAVTISEA